MAAWPAVLDKLSTAWSSLSVQHPQALARGENAHASAINALETYLGINPQGASADVATRLAAIDATIASIVGSSDPRVASLAGIWTPVIPRRQGVMASAAGQGTYLFVLGAVGSGPALAAVNTATTGTSPVYLKGSEVPAITGLTPKWRVRGGVAANAVAPGASTVFTFELRPVGSWGGASGSATTVVTLSAAVTGSGGAVSNPAAAGPATGDSSAFTIPADGWYVPVITLSGANNATNSVPILHWQMDQHYE